VRRVRTDTIARLKALKYLRARNLIDGFWELKLSTRGRRVMWRYSDRQKAEGDGRWNRSGR
jgi:hypothetical protein